MQAAGSPASNAHTLANAEAIEHYTHAIDATAKVPLTASGAIETPYASRGGILSVIGRHQEAIDDYASRLSAPVPGNDRARECRFLLGLSLAQFNAHQIEAR